MEKKFQRNRWGLACPAPSVDTESIPQGYYNAGSGLADDTVTESREFSLMQIISEADEALFDRYTGQLEEAGLTRILDNVIGKNRYRAYTDGKTVWQISYVAYRGELRVTEDVCSTPLSDFTYQAKGDRKTVVYQYGLYYDPDNDVTDRTVNCGMFYVIRLSDNSLILVDGGHIFQASDKTVAHMMDFLHEITGTQEGETVTVAAWYITHAHGDHVSGTAKLLNRYHEQIDLRRVMYNFPSFQVRSSGYDPLTTIAKGIVRRLYPDVQFLKLHSGMRFSLADTEIEVLYTHEDVVYPETGFTYTPGDYNCTSTVLRLFFDGKSVLLLGDISEAAEAVMAQSFDAEVLKSDVVQVAHHCFNLLESIYNLADAPIALMPNSYNGSHQPENLVKLAEVLKHVKDDQIYYEDSRTVGLAVEDGEMRVVYDHPTFSEEYDFSRF